MMKHMICASAVVEVLATHLSRPSSSRRITVGLPSPIPFAISTQFWGKNGQVVRCCRVLVNCYHYINVPIGLFLNAQSLVQLLVQL